MSNSRRPAVGNAYRSYLRSPAWFARRARWFREQTAQGEPIICPACGEVGDGTTLHLHHLDYQGVSRSDGGWRASERHDDLVPLHPNCHETLHRLIERDTVLSRHRSRRDATVIGLEKIRAAFANTKESR